MERESGLLLQEEQAQLEDGISQSVATGNETFPPLKYASISYSRCTVGHQH
jgi:hypothetical protein